MEEKDLETVAELAMLANPFAEKDSYKKHIIEELKENPELSLVAVNEKDEVLGYAQADIRGGIAVLEDIAVSQDWQGRGIGKQLLEKELEELKRKGAKIVMAEVHYKCAKAIPFYYKFGFRIVGFVQDYFGKGHDAIILKTELQAK
jgi:ribosomal protein S18 acetylase RimI-like enzyme